MTGWIIQTFVATSLLMLAVLAVREAVARRYGARAAYALWLAPALRLILPPMHAQWLAGRNEAFGGAITFVHSNLPVGRIFQSSPTFDWTMIAFFIWIVGAVSFFAWHVTLYLRFARAAKNGADWQEEQGISVATNAIVLSPVAFGLIDKIIALPSDFGRRYSAMEQRLALAHEVAHHRRHDLPASLAALAILSLNWFNPVAYLAHRAFRTDQEAACDAQVLDGATPQERHAYGIALFKSATAGTPLAACATAAAVTIKTRLARLSTRGGSVAALSLIGAGASMAALLTASSAFVPKPRMVGKQIALARAPHQTVAAPKQREVALVSPPVRGVTKAPQTELAVRTEHPAEHIKVITPAVVAMSAPTTPTAKTNDIVLANCAGSARPPQALIARFEDEQGVREMQMIMCEEPAASAVGRPSVMLEALASMRAQIATDPFVSGLMRAQLLESLDQQIQLQNAPQEKRMILIPIATLSTPKEQVRT